jgi:hypothetical protein
MDDTHTTDRDAGTTGSGPRHQSDDTTASDAGLTGDEGGQHAEPAIAHDDDDDGEDDDS